MTSSDVQFGILGPLEIIDRGRGVELRGRMLRTLLAVLLVNRGQVLTSDQLVDELWGTRPPRNARRSLHNLVSALRATCTAETLATVGGGYALGVRAEQVDAARFESLVYHAARAPAPEQACTTLTTAFALWRGSPLVDVRYEDFAQAEILRLEELHAWALEQRFEAELELGDADRLVPELASLVARFPFREKLRRLLILALHRSGRSIEALEAFAAWRGLLGEPWGLEPGRAVSQLVDEIRAGAPSLAEAMTLASGSPVDRAPTRRRRGARRQGACASRLGRRRPRLARPTTGGAVARLSCLRSSRGRAPGFQLGDSGSTPLGGFPTP